MKTKIVWLYVLDTMSDWEPAYAVSGIGSTPFQLRPGEYRVRTASIGGRPVTTMGGIRIMPDAALGDISPEDGAMLIVPGGATWDDDRNREAVEVARSFLGAGLPIAAICGATAGFARAGLLDAVRHTSNSRDYLLATKYGGAALYEDAPAVTDGNVITAPGTGALEFAMHIFRRLDIYAPDVLDAWYNLFKTGRPEYFDALMRLTQEAR